MNNKLQDSDIKELSEKYNIEEAIIKSFVSVESSGTGYSKSTGKILIQFEPKYFSRLEPNAPKTIWYSNKIDIQCKEWDAFDNAAKYNKDSAIQSTSFGLMQVMGIHYKELGFKNPQSFYDFAVESEKNQLEIGILFIVHNKALFKAIKDLDFDKMAYYYNGANYKEQAKRLGIKPYNEQLKFYYNKYKNK